MQNPTLAPYQSTNENAGTLPLQVLYSLGPFHCAKSTNIERCSEL